MIEIDNAHEEYARKHKQGPQIAAAGSDIDYSYEYNYINEKEINVTENKKKEDGDRLVGGTRSSTRFSQQFKFEEKKFIRIFPFVVGWNLHGFPDMMSCSGEILMRTFLYWISYRT